MNDPVDNWFAVTVEHFTNYINHELYYPEEHPEGRLREIMEQFDGTDNLDVELHDVLPYPNILEFTRIWIEGKQSLHVYQFTGFVQAPTLDSDKLYFRFILDDACITVLEEVQKPSSTVAMSMLWSLIGVIAWNTLLATDHVVDEINVFAISV